MSQGTSNTDNHHSYSDSPSSKSHGEPVPLVQVPLDQLPPDLNREEVLNPHGAEHEELRVIRDRLAAQSGLVTRLGKLLLSAGASAYLVKLSMARLARAIGLEEHHSQVTFSEIITSSYAHGTFRTESTEQRMFGTNAARLDDLRRFVQDLKPHTLIEEANAKLDEIAARPPVYPALVNWLASGLACACFGFLNHGGIAECLGVGIAAFFGQMLRRAMMHRHMNHFGIWMLCALVASAIYIGVTQTLHLLGIMPSAHPGGIISAVLFLVPGFPLVTAILDLVRMDFSAGISRMTYVVMLVISAGISVWLIATIFHWHIDPPSTFPVSGWQLYLLQLICSFVASFGFAILFSIPPHICLIAALMASFVNVGRIFLTTTGLAPQAAVGIAALTIGILAHFISLSAHYRLSRVSLSVPAVVIMIPGVPLYAAITHLAEGQIGLASDSLVTVGFVILAIGVGLALSRMLTDPGWRIDRDTAAPLDLNESDSKRRKFTMR